MWAKNQTKCWLKTGTNLVIMGDLLVGGGVDKRSSVVDCVVGERGGVVDGVVANWGSVDERGSVVDDGLVGAGNTLVLHVSVVLGVVNGGSVFHVYKCIFICVW